MGEHYILVKQLVECETPESTVQKKFTLWEIREEPV